VKWTQSCRMVKCRRLVEGEVETELQDGEVKEACGR
jgi:hypothetical protein